MWYLGVQLSSSGLRASHSNAINIVIWCVTLYRHSLTPLFPLDNDFITLFPTTVSSFKVKDNAWTPQTINWHVAFFSSEQILVLQSVLHRWSRSGWSVQRHRQSGTRMHELVQGLLSCCVELQTCQGRHHPDIRVLPGRCSLRADDSSGGLGSTQALQERFLFHCVLRPSGLLLPGVPLQNTGTLVFIPGNELSVNAWNYRAKVLRILIARRSEKVLLPRNRDRAQKIRRSPSNSPLAIMSRG